MSPLEYSITRDGKITETGKLPKETRTTWDLDREMELAACGDDEDWWTISLYHVLDGSSTGQDIFINDNHPGCMFYPEPGFKFEATWVPDIQE